MDDFLSRNAYVLNTADRARFLPMFSGGSAAEVNRDLEREPLSLRTTQDQRCVRRNAPSPSKQIDFPAAFEFYCDKAGIKGGATGATAKRWRPKIKAFCRFHREDGLHRMATDRGAISGSTILSAKVSR